jgi:hypothetical protein
VQPPAQASPEQLTPQKELAQEYSHIISSHLNPAHSDVSARPQAASTATDPIRTAMVLANNPHRTSMASCILLKYMWEERGYFDDFIIIFRLGNISHKAPCVKQRPSMTN